MILVYVVSFSDSFPLHILGQLVTAGNANDATIGPLVTQLTTQINNAKFQIAELPPTTRKLAKRQSDQDIANLVGGLVNVSIV